MMIVFRITEGKRQKLWQSAEHSLNFKANDDNLDFDNRNLDANDNYSGGVLFLGKFLQKITLVG
jgi:hypothetical protein